MTDHAGLPVKGYVPQSDDKVAKVNRNKILEEQVLRALDDLNKLLKPQVDHRWLAIARTHIETGFMAMNRAVFQPQRIKLEFDNPGADEISVKDGDNRDISLRKEILNSGGSPNDGGVPPNDPA